VNVTAPAAADYLDPDAINPGGPFQIVYVGNFTRPWCTEVHVAASLEALGHTVHRVQENELSWPDLPHLVRQVGAHVLLWTRTWDVPVEACRDALARVRGDGVPVGFFHLDRWWGLAREYQIAEMPWFQSVDVVFSPDGGNDARWRDVGVTHVYMPPGVYGPEAQAGGTSNRRRYPADVVFVGTFPYPHPEWADYRAGLINAFRSAFGRRFMAYPRGRAVRGRELADLYASAKVVIGDSCLAGGANNYWSDRVPETLGRGGLLIHPYVGGMDDWYVSSVDLIGYGLGDYAEAVERAKWAISDPGIADEIRRQGRATVLARDTYRHRMAMVLRCMDELVGIPRDRQPKRPKVNVPPALAVHSPTRQRGAFHLAEGVTDRVAVREVWEDDTYGLRREHVAGKTVVDIGANVGAFTVLAAKAGARRVHAYEPHPDTHRVLVDNLRANGVQARVIPYEAAVVGGSGPYERVMIHGDGGGASLGAPVIPQTDDNVAAAVMPESSAVFADAVGIGDVIAKAGDVGLLKIDCEGAEYRIFFGPLDWLERVERIVMEFHGPKMGPHLEWLGASGAAAHLMCWGDLVTNLACYGRVSIFGRPMVGGLITWTRY
jgi:FkbM family methyltransferase